jgi:uncharacterized protein YprB with RNaseH-like and TPR domain
MSDLQAQLAELRQRIARVSSDCDRKFSARATPEFVTFSPFNETPRPGHEYVAEWMAGDEVETEFGRHLETEKLYERHRRHGSADIGALADLPPDLFECLSGEPMPRVPPEQWAFLDTETTGLAGGAGTCAFLIGVGRITHDGFRVRQFFMRDHGEEASTLDALSRHLAQFRVMITYNGRAYDQPLLETRYRLNRAKPPFARMEHLDLLHGARRLWKLRFESCRLVDLENQVLGVERQGDLAGALIPYVYFEYLRTRNAARMIPIFHHNALDILTLACLTAIVPYAFREPGSPENGSSPLTNGAELAGIARWLRQAGELDHARKLFRRAIDAAPSQGMTDDLLFQTLWDLAAIERKLGATDRALGIWNDLAGSRNAFRAAALEELAKHYEHREKDHVRALDLTRAALELEDTADLRKREDRLKKKLAVNKRECT